MSRFLKNVFYLKPLALSLSKGARARIIMQQLQRTAGIIIVIGIAIALLLYGYKKGFTQETSMAERTFAMIKPDAVAAKNSGKIIDIIENNGFTIVRMEKVKLNKQKAEEFYAVHKERPFFGELVNFVTSGPVIVMALEKENGVKAWRDLMGATDPQKAAEGTIRKQFGANIGNNATHGSDALETAKVELALFFPDLK
ncbi:MAG TPA: nucleoside-diphosphate kinase [Candidatus Limnocylindria bacterium]|nr:nucleoside-diphosphate kinase [Candidatus Limnocylindria bacterium]